MINDNNYEGAKCLVDNTPIPMCVICKEGKVRSASKRIDDVFKYDGIEGADIFAITGIKSEDLWNTDENREFKLSRNNKIFKVDTYIIEDEALAIYFIDITEQEQIKKIYEKSKICIALVNVDNYDELKSSTSDGNRLNLLTTIDRAIRNWASKGTSAIIRTKEHQYVVMFEESFLAKQIDQKFDILDSVREIETEADFPVTLSIGIGTGGETQAENDNFSNTALDLALGRGGDQAVVKQGQALYYFGGRTKTVEKNNKGKSRIIAHAIKRLVDQSSKVLIMGHKNPDMDAFGASMGIQRLVVNQNKEAYIIINSYYETLAAIYNQAKEKGIYNFIDTEKALELMDDDTLVVVVDTHRPSLVESMEVVEKAEKLVVIDHHRKTEENIENATLSYMEPYASSASELVTEIIQYAGEKKNLEKIEAEALLGGIFMDTNRFAVKTGVRTFEAAAWLRRSGADTTMVKRYFQTEERDFKIKARCIAEAKIGEDGIAYSESVGIHPDIQVINAQAADELLSIKGIIASFVAGKNDQGYTIISGRSLGDLNVQRIMEKVGGGGHLTTAGARMECSPKEALEQIKEIVDEYFEYENKQKEENK